MTCGAGLRDSPPNWVARRLACTNDLVFDSLKEIVERDVCEINKQSPEGRKFHIERGSGGLSERLRIHRDDGCFVTIAKCGGRISIVPHKQPEFEAHIEWDNDTLSCKVYVGEHYLEVWQLSKRALSGFFFE